MLAVSSFSLILSSIGNYKGNTINVIAAILAGSFFWLFLIGGYLLFALISGHRKEYEKLKKDSGNSRRVKRRNNRPGIICFFSNKYAAVADFALFISFFLILLFLFIPSVSRNIVIIMISVFVYSLHMHSILNGRNFKYIVQLSK